MRTVQKSESDRKDASKWAKLWRSWIKPFAAVLIVMATFRSAVADWNDVPTGSMKPTILEGDRIFVNKLAYDLKVPFTRWHLFQWSDPKRGDIVVFPSPFDEVRLVKRVVGIPGDRLELRDNQLLINGEPANYGPLDPGVRQQLTAIEQGQHRFAVETVAGKSHPVMTRPQQPGPETFGPVIVPPEQYFVMGDNRDGSFDSRFFGFVERDRIVGRATSVVMSLDVNHYLQPRWQRFFHGLP